MGSLLNKLVLSLLRLSARGGKEKGCNINSIDNFGLVKVDVLYYPENKRGQGKTTT